MVHRQLLFRESHNFIILGLIGGSKIICTIIYTCVPYSKFQFLSLNDDGFPEIYLDNEWCWEHVQIYLLRLKNLKSENIQLFSFVIVS